MKIDALIAEIGSTTTVVNAFDQLDSHPVFIGQGMAPTSILQGDVRIGLKQAMTNLEEQIKVQIEPKLTLASSSAAGGLKMSVHGLVYDMTVKAAKEAALGAGANIKLITAGLLTDADLERIKETPLNIMMVAGGVDYGDSAISLANAGKLASLQLSIPIIYAGNIVNHQAVQDVFTRYQQTEYLFITENVYPRIDEINIEPVRKIIHQVFENHIVHAPGMEGIRALIHQNIIPTPGAVYELCLLLQKKLGNLVCVDVGGATTDVFSIGEETHPETNISITPEPFAKRTVEGDLGVYINRYHLAEQIGYPQLEKELGISRSYLEALLRDYQAIPPALQLPLTRRLAKEALAIALKRHAGTIHHHYLATGKVKVIEGKDLSEFPHILATGGALTRLPDGKAIIKECLEAADPKSLKPSPGAHIWLDHHYIAASLGVLAKVHPQAAVKLILESMNKKEE